MELRWTRTALDARLESLESRYSGKELVDAVVSFADTLTDEDKKLLEDVLLERAGKQVQIVPGWIDASKRRRRRFSLPPRPRDTQGREEDDSEQS